MGKNVTIAGNPKPKKTVDFKVAPYEHNMLRQFEGTCYNQEIEDVETKHHCRLLEKPYI
jgi:hypothetical protein